MELSTVPTAPDLVERLRAAQPAWARRPVAERLRPVRALRRLIADECDALCEAARRDLGKAPEETIAGDLLPLADACLFLEREAGRLLRPRRVPAAQRPIWLWGQGDRVHRRPRGVVGIIGTWNYPYLLNGVPVVQALAAGNAVLWKPSEVAPGCAAALDGLFRRAGFPDDLIHRTEATREAGPALVEAAVDHVVFTGSAAVGRRVAARLGERLVSCTLELSGCDAMFVLADADAALAARAAWFGATTNRGQTCVAVRRAFVHRSVYSAFCDLLRAEASAAAPRCGWPWRRRCWRTAERLVRGALGRRRAVVDRPLTGALPQGATAERNGDPAAFPQAGGRGGRPARTRPLCREVPFAPVLAVLPFDSLEEVRAIASGRCPYGLAASVFTRERRQGGGAGGSLLPAGMVTVNDVVRGRRAHSGHAVRRPRRQRLGRQRRGRRGLLEMTTVRRWSAIPRRLVPAALRTGGGPGSGEAGADLLRGLLESAHAPTLGRRWRGWRRLLAALWRGV